MEARSTRKRLIVIVSLLLLTLTLVLWFLLGQPAMRKLVSPVCDKVTFVRGHSIYVANPDGSDRTRLVRSPSLLNNNEPIQFAWSPNGTMLAYSIGNLTMYDARLYILHLDQTNERLWGNIRAHSLWGWSPDSKYISVDHGSLSGPRRFILYSVSLGESVCADQYDSYNPVVACGPFNIFHGKWWLPFQSVEGSDDHRWSLAPELEGAVVKGKPYPSPDKQWVAFSTYNVDDNDWRHHIAKANGENLLTYYTTKEWRGFCLGTTWSPNSQHLVFAVQQDGQMHLSIISLEDHNVVPLAHFDGGGCPYDLKWHDNGERIGFFIGKPAPRKWYVVEVASNQVVSLPLDDSACSWSQSGDWIGCSFPDSIAVLRIDPLKRFDLSDVEGRGVWSPSDRWFGFATVEGVFAFDTVTGEITQISDRKSVFTWTPACK